MKTLAVTYHPNVQQLVAAASAQHDAGNYRKYVTRVPLEDDRDGAQDRVSLSMAKLNTLYSKEYDGESLCLIFIDKRDVYRDTEAEGYDPEYVPMCEALGLTVLAYGPDCWGQIKNNPDALALHRRVLPDREVLDENGNGTGVYEFQPGGSFTAPLWC